jgi:Flp pilus assembly protein TadG
MTLDQILLRSFKTFKRDTRGTSAIEFALVAPMLVIVTVGLADVSNMGFGSSNMQTAVRAGTHYAMAGGTDPTVAKTHAESAWTRKPDDGVVTTSRVCKCAGAEVDSCETFCPDNSRPEMYMTVTATGTLGGDFYSMSQTSTQTVRIR